MTVITDIGLNISAQIHLHLPFKMTNIAYTMIAIRAFIFLAMIINGGCQYNPPGDHYLREGFGTRFGNPLCQSNT